MVSDAFLAPWKGPLDSFVTALLAFSLQQVDLRTFEEYSLDNDKLKRNGWEELIARVERFDRNAGDGQRGAWVQESANLEVGDKQVVVHRISILNKDRFQRGLVFHKMDITSIVKVGIPLVRFPAPWALLHSNLQMEVQP